MRQMKWLVVLMVGLIPLLISCATLPIEPQKPNSKSTQTEKEACLEKLQKTASLMMEVRHNYQEWYINPIVWVGFSLSEKENMIKGLSQCRKVVVGYGLVVIKDGYSGKKLGVMGVMGPKIYR